MGGSARRGVLSAAAPGERTWDVLRAKSALPTRAIALVAAPRALAHRGRPPVTMREEVIRVGELLWIVDDLLDARADWAAGVWSRPWIQSARDGGEHVKKDPLAALAGGPIPLREAREAADRARAAPALGARRGNMEVGRSLGVSIESWLRAAQR